MNDAMEATFGEFGTTDLKRACPGVSRDLIRLRLRILKAAGLNECLGQSPKAKRQKRIIPLKEGKKEANRNPNLNCRREILEKDYKLRAAVLAKPINAGIKLGGEGKSEWIRKALLSAAANDKPEP